MKDLNKIPRLTYEELAELMLRKSELAVRNKIAESFLPLVVKLARKAALTMDLDDLISEGSLGLLRAIEKFDGSLNKSFVRYAEMWINSCIYRFIHKNINLVRNNPLRENTNFEKTTFTLGLMEEYIGEEKVNQELMDSRLTLNHLLSNLKPRIRKMVECRYNNENPQTLDSIGTLFETSKQNVEERIQVAIKHMRQDYERDMCGDLPR